MPEVPFGGGDVDGTDISPSSVTTDDSRTKTRPVVDVTHPDFGAVGDGTTDDTQAINDAISAAPAGAELFFPRTDSGYVVSSTITYNKDLIWDMGSPMPYRDGTISGAYLKQANGSDNSVLVQPASAIQTGGQINVDGNRGNQTTAVTGVEIDTLNLKHFEIGAVNCDTGVEVLDETENCRIGVFAAQCGDALVDSQTGTQDEVRYYLNAHNVTRGFVCDGDATGGSSVISAEVSVEQASQQGIDIVANGTVSLISPEIRGADEPALRTQNGVEVTVQGGHLQTTANTGFYAVSTQGTSTVTCHGTSIQSNTHECEVLDSSTLELIGCKHLQGRRVANVGTDATAVVRDPAVIGTHVDRTFNGSGELTASLKAAQIRDADFVNNAANSHITVTTPVTDAERADIPIGTGSVVIYNSDQQRHQYGQGGSWTEPTTQSA